MLEIGFALYDALIERS